MNTRTPLRLETVDLHLVRWANILVRWLYMLSSICPYHGEENRGNHGE